MKKDFLELYYLNKVIRKLSPLGSMFHYETLAEVQVKGKTFPIYGIEIGPQDKNLPVLGLFGGVHGLEKIGTHVIANYLNALANEVAWNSSLAKRLETFRVVSIPLVNPGGMYLNYRSNPNGVDLMRNAPVDADVKTRSPGAGHYITKWLPWYRGNPQDMEIENKALTQFVKDKMFDSPFSMALDIHSGFGWVDRLWYPYGKTLRAYEDEYLARRLARFLKVTNPFHSYKIEKQSDSYLINGDIWDYLYDGFKEVNTDKARKFLPWTLEIGSWSWLLSQPQKIFQAKGLFHTTNSSKYAVVMRKHWGLLNFFKNMTVHHQSWVCQNPREEEANRVVGF